MPSFDLQCPKCEKVYTVTFTFSEFDEVAKQKCPDCDEPLKRIYSGQAAQVFIPAQFGVTKKGFI